LYELQLAGQLQMELEVKCGGASPCRLKSTYQP
jgi:hypothetical protein